MSGAQCTTAYLRPLHKGKQAVLRQWQRLCGQLQLADQFAHFAPRAGGLQWLDGS